MMSAVSYRLEKEHKLYDHVMVEAAPYRVLHAAGLQSPGHRRPCGVGLLLLVAVSLPCVGVTKTLHYFRVY